METEKKNIIIRVDADFHRELKTYLAKNSMTFQDYVVELIINDFAQKRKEQVDGTGRK